MDIAKLRNKFKKDAKLTSELPPVSPVIGDVVKYETSNNTKKKRKNDFPKEESTSIKKSKEDLVPDDVVLLKQELKKRLKPVERKKIFIRNVRKDCTYEDFQEKVEKFGEVVDFFNPGRGCFITFSSAKAAQECVAALNKTEIAGKVVLMNIAREESESGLESNTIEGCTLFVHGVKQETDEEDIKAAFEEFGKVVDSFNPGKGFAFVTFSNPEEATAAAEALTGKEVCGSTVSVNVSKPKVKTEADKNEGVKTGKNKKEKKEGIRLFVNNVSEDTSQDDLKAAFSAHGSVTDAYNPGKGFAFVDFATEDEANAAIEALNGKEVCGKEVECNIAKFKKKVQKGKARS